MQGSSAGMLDAEAAGLELRSQNAQEWGAGSFTAATGVLDAEAKQTKKQSPKWLRREEKRVVSDPPTPHWPGLRAGLTLAWGGIGREMESRREKRFETSIWHRSNGEGREKKGKEGGLLM